MLFIWGLTHVAPHAYNAHMTTGMDLKLRRVAADVRVKDLAGAMGVTSSRISHIERSRIVTPEAEAGYVAALSKCTTTNTGTASAA